MLDKSSFGWARERHCCMSCTARSALVGAYSSDLTRAMDVPVQGLRGLPSVKSPPTRAPQSTASDVASLGAPLIRSIGLRVGATWRPATYGGTPVRHELTKHAELADRRTFVGICRSREMRQLLLIICIAGTAKPVDQCRSSDPRFCIRDGDLHAHATKYTGWIR